VYVEGKFAGFVVVERVGVEVVEHTAAVHDEDLVVALVELTERGRPGPLGQQQWQVQVAGDRQTLPS